MFSESVEEVIFVITFNSLFPALKRSCRGRVENRKRVNRNSAARVNSHEKRKTKKKNEKNKNLKVNLVYN